MALPSNEGREMWPSVSEIGPAGTEAIAGNGRGRNWRYTANMSWWCSSPSTKAMSLLIVRRCSSKSVRVLRSLRWQQNALHLPPLAHFAAKAAKSLVVATKSFMGFCTWARGPTARSC
ncbi:unnamed protein product [Ectocarpus sp. 12 AP-2014]